MKQNVGTLDRIIRVVAGIALLSFVFTTEGDLRWLGLIGVLPLVSGLIGFCWAYKMCGCNTCCCSSKGEKSEGGCCGSKSCATEEKPAEEKQAGHCGCGHGH